MGERMRNEEQQREAGPAPGGHVGIVMLSAGVGAQNTDHKTCDRTDSSYQCWKKGALQSDFKSLHSQTCDIEPLNFQGKAISNRWAMGQSDLTSLHR